jgi:hypothetical protein
VPKELATLDGDVCAILIIEAQLICRAGDGENRDGLRERRDRLLGRLRVRQIEQLIRIVSSLDSLVTPVRPPGGKGSTPTPTAGRQEASEHETSAGSDRAEAAVSLHSDEIAAFIADDSAIDAELWSIDENLTSAELSPAEEMAFIGRRKKLWEMKGAQVRSAASASALTFTSPSE